jgi:acylphosphatase
VQGVWFRATTRQQAERLGLRGSVHNRPDGSVEVEACGEEAALQALREWLWQGPEHARVEAVQCEALLLPEEPYDFVIS